MRPLRYLLADPCPAGFSDWTRSTGRPCRRMLLVPVIGRRGEGFGATSASVIEIYQGLIRPFQRLGKTYEHRCGQPYARTIAALADRRYAYGAGEIDHLAHTCLTP
jgi:hypothetical protein